MSNDEELFVETKKKKLDRLISELVSVYKDDTRKVIHIAIQHGVTYQQIADALGTTKQNIEQQYKIK